jgi:hypothetical protein
VTNVKEQEKKKEAGLLLKVLCPSVLLKTMPSGKKFILCIPDTPSKYVELFAIPDKSAPTVASVLFSR